MLLQSPSHTVRSLLFVAVMLTPVLGATAQEKQPAPQQANREAAFDLYRQHRLVEAAPLFEELLLTSPNDPALLESLAFCLLAKAVSIEDPAERRQTRVRARELLLRSKELGNDSNLLHVLLEGLPPDGNAAPYSSRPDVDAAMQAGEAAFSRGDFDEAIKQYQLALALEPASYLAPLFLGDVHYKKGNWEEAGKWFALAIRNDANRETAYRYWGDALMRAGQMSEARAKFIDAVVAEPYTRAAWTGIVQWAQTNKVQLAHPRIESPNRLQQKDDKTSTIILDVNTLNKKDGSSAWLVYEITRAVWQRERFKREFPDEPDYRHSLREETEALQSVIRSVQSAQKEKKIEKLEPSLAVLLELESKNLLEAYVLFARADEGIAQDYIAYRKGNRDKLHRYLDEYVVPKVD